MRPRVVVLAILALVLALVTSHYVRRSLDQSRHRGAVVQVTPRNQVMVAAHDLASGTLITAADLRWQSWPDGTLDKAYALQGRDDMQTFAGAVVRQHIATGMPITAGMVIKPGERGFLAAVLAPGMRAISVPLTMLSDDSGLVLPGDHVDLILLHSVTLPNAPGSTPRLIAETIDTDLRVVAIDENINDQDKKVLSGKTATLEVTPKQAERVEVAERIGNLSMILRSAGAPLDATMAAVRGSHTWDSDVSRFIQHDIRVQDTVTILRGGTSNR